MGPRQANVEQPIPCDPPPPLFLHPQDAIKVLVGCLAERAFLTDLDAATLRLRPDESVPSEWV